MLEVTKIMATSFKRSHAHSAALSAPSPAAGHCQPTPPPETPGHSRAGSVSCGSLLLSPMSRCAQVSVCALQESVSQSYVSKFWWLNGGVNGDLLQEGLCHTQVCCTQSPCWSGRPRLTRAFAGHTHTQFWLSYVECLGPGAHRACWSPLSVSGMKGI